MKPLFPATIITLFLASTKLLAQVAGTPATPGPEIDWTQLIQVPGMAGVLIWMLMWSQKRIEAKDVQVQNLTTELTKAVASIADAQRDTATAMGKIAEAINNSRK